MTPMPDDAWFQHRREQLVVEQLMGRGIDDQRVLDAFRRIPRHLFVDQQLQERAYDDNPLCIGDGQTISQPYMVAVMLARLALLQHERVLEIGSGSGYQTALLAVLCDEVYSVDRVARFAELTHRRLDALGLDNVRVQCADGTLGWPEFAPYDAIIVSAAAPAVPAPLLAQLKDGGRLAVPVGAREQQTFLVVRRDGPRTVTESHEGCRFVPLIGEFGWPDPAERKG